MQDPCFDAAPWGAATPAVLHEYVRQLAGAQGGTPQQLAAAQLCYLASLRNALAACSSAPSK